MSQTKDDGGPAFPFEIRHQKVLPSGQGVGPVSILTHHGMMLRDWLAGQALSGPLAAIFPVYIPDRKDGGDYSVKQIAAVAYRIADAMIAERSK